ncbi:hypothetical protein ABBQ32_002196 [Trebouxia sp. C0010 RCD-2024]
MDHFWGCAAEASCSTPNVPFQSRPRLSKEHTRRTPNIRPPSTGARPVAPCRVTNTGEEMIEPGIFGDPNYMEFDQMQIPHPELGPLERRVEKTYEEALFEDDISIEDAEYWFTEPPGGWNQEKKRLRKATVVPNDYPDAKNFGEGRIQATDLKEGQELIGTINRCMLFHGAQVDIGAQYDALIPIGEDSWIREGPTGVKELQEVLQLEVEVRIRVHKIVDSPICRFPIIAELLSPSLDYLLPDVRKYEPVFDLRGQSDIEMAKQLTGRTYNPTKYWLDVVPDTPTRALTAVNDDLNIDDAKEPSETMSPALLSRIRDMAAAR